MYQTQTFFLQSLSSYTTAAFRVLRGMGVILRADVAIVGIINFLFDRYQDQQEHTYVIKVIAFDVTRSPTYLHSKNM